MIKKNNYIDIIFYAFVFIYIFYSQLLIWIIPYSFPNGGPDELMHISMAQYISQHLSWPHWDSKDIIRNSYGVSYSTGGSIVYWIHGIFYKFFGHHRLGSFFLLLVYLFISIVLYKRNKLSGYLLLAGLLPQTIFVFSYVNSDTGTIITALLLGISVGLFLVKSSIKNFYIMMFFAGFSITARQHMWAIAFFTLILALIYKKNIFKEYKIKIFIISIIIALIPASWWFITSFIANNGDILGVFASVDSIKKFSQHGLPILARDWKDFSLDNFCLSTMISLYANWGWLNLSLDIKSYIFIAIIAILLLFIIYKFIGKKIFLFLATIVVINFSFMIVYSTFYDYQAQGRYLFPSFYLSIGLISIVLIKKQIHSKLLLYALIFFGFTNIYYITLLTYYNYLPKQPILSNYKIKNSYQNSKLFIDEFKIKKNSLLIKGWVFDLKSGKPFDNLKLILKSKKNIYSIDLKKERRDDVAKVFHNKKLLYSGFSLKNLNLKDIKKGKYKCFIEGKLNDKTIFIDCKKSLIH